MIELRALNGEIFFLNPDLIYRIEELPDTMITLTDGKTLYVENSAQAVVDTILQYRQLVMHPNLNEGV